MGIKDSKNRDNPNRDGGTVQVGEGRSQDSRGSFEGGGGARIASGGLRAVLRLKLDCPSQVRSKTLKGESVHEKLPRTARDMCYCVE